LLRFDAGEVTAAAGNRLPDRFGFGGGAGELKKLVAAKTGLHPDDQKVLYKDKERDSKAFLDMAGVKDRSKLVVVEDPEAKARRLIEERRNGRLEKAAKAVAAVAAEVDKLAPKVRPSVTRIAHPKIASFSEPIGRRAGTERNRGVDLACSPLVGRWRRWTRRCARGRGWRRTTWCR